jgi:hypothetical protein
MTFRAGQCFEVPAGCMHAEHVGPEGVALMSGRRRNGGPLTREAFESDDFDARIMVLAGEITVTRDGKSDVFHAGDHCEIPAGCQHTTLVGAEGVAYMVGKACRHPATN